GVPVRLEERIVQLAPFIDLVLVAVQDVGFRMGDVVLGEKRQSVVGELVVMVEEYDEVAGCERARRIRRRGDVSVRRPEGNLDPYVSGQRFTEDSPHVRRSRRIIRNAQLPSIVEL